MVYYILAVYDIKYDAMHHPFVTPDIPNSIRQFVDLMSTTEHQFNRNPQDYQLIQIGTVLSDDLAKSGPTLTKEKCVLFNGMDFDAIKTEIKK